MNAIKGWLGDSISAAFSLARTRSAAECRVLMYHAVGGYVANDRQDLYSISPDLFAAHVRLLAESAHVKDLETAVASGDGVAITFDDGYRDNLTVAAPLLACAKLPFTVFVTPDFIRGGERQYLSAADLRELAQVPGATVGAHGRSHRRLTECSDIDLASELKDSKAWLEDLLGRPVKTMSYPHGATNERAQAAVARIGYTIAACSRFGAHHRADDPFAVARIEVWSSDSAARLRAKLNGTWDWLAWRAA